MNKIPPEIIGGVAAGLAVLLVLVLLYRYLLKICRPNEILIFSGRKQKAADGRMVGYRVVFGGRGMRIPIVETVHEMDVSLISVPMQVQGAYSEGGIPLNVHAIANIKVSTDRRYVGNAIERFLGMGRSEIARVVKETLEGHLRGVVPTLDPEGNHRPTPQVAPHPPTAGREVVEQSSCARNRQPNRTVAGRQPVPQRRSADGVSRAAEPDAPEQIGGRPNRRGR